MKTVKNNSVRPVRLSLFFATVFALALLSLAGCSSGGGTSPAPGNLATPTPTPTPLQSSIPSTSSSGVTTRANYDPTTGNPSVSVSFPAYTAVSVEKVVEYHIFRTNDAAGTPGGTLVGHIERSAAQEQGATLQFLDMQLSGPVPTYYQQIKNGQPTGAALETTNSFGGGLFRTDGPTVYQVTLLYQTQDGTYAETEIGRSNSISLYQ